MANQSRKRQDLNTLERLLEYSKYLYEQENQRNEKLSSITNTYLVVITFAFTFLSGLMNLISPYLVSLSKIQQMVFYISLGVAVLLILLSLVFTVLVVKVRSFERLCNPKEFISKAELLDGAEELIGSMISNYVVATERSFLVNNQKAKFLSYGLQSFVVGFVLLLFTLSSVYIFGM